MKHQIKSVTAALLVCLMTVTSSTFGIGGGGGGGGDGGPNGEINVFSFSPGGWSTNPGQLNFVATLQNWGHIGGFIIFNGTMPLGFGGTGNYGNIAVDGRDNSGHAAVVSGCIRGGSIVPCRNKNGSDVEPEPEPIGILPFNGTQSTAWAAIATYLVEQNPYAAVTYYNSLPAGDDKDFVAFCLAMRGAALNRDWALAWAASLINKEEKAMALTGITAIERDEAIANTTTVP